MEADETIFIVAEWDFSDPNIAKDWSIVAQAADGKLTLTHTKGYTSD